VPGRSRLFERFQEERVLDLPDANPARTESLASAFQKSGGIGTPGDFRAHVKTFENAGVDQIILLQQAGRNRHEHICESLTLLGNEVLPEFAQAAAERERRKAEELAPHIERALARKQRMPPIADADIPVVKAAVVRPMVNMSSQSR
jgi:isopentenyl diphosphate isomerase/L-lactate dehydrogenase-like FMN-dependent dehydrogenase